MENAFEQITFAGFKLPRVENMPTLRNPTVSSLAERFREWKARGKKRGFIGPVTFPNRIRSAETAREFNGWGCYLSCRGTLDDRWFSLRWAYCDDIPGGWYDVDDASYHVDHKGWFIDDMQDETLRGIVVKLPRGRGFLAGWTMGEGMITEIDSTVYADCSDAVSTADSMAERIAESEREYRCEECEECGEHPDLCECEGEEDGQ